MSPNLLAIGHEGHQLADMKVIDVAVGGAW
jgi:hypothetical protein